MKSREIMVRLFLRTPIMAGVLAVSLLSCSFPDLVSTPTLFKIYHNGKVGYIDKKGRTVIEPVFANGNDFSEGLAAVRLNGSYGYISESGVFVIEPEYDLASDFVNGLAFVYKDGHALCIDKTGKQALPDAYVRLSFVDNRTAVVTSRGGKQGIIDVRTKQLKVDTIFSAIQHFEDGIAIVHQVDQSSADEEHIKDKVGVVDSVGRFLVPMGKYSSIEPFSEGYAVFKLYSERDEYGATYGAIDNRGNLVFSKHLPFPSSIGPFHNGFATVRLFKDWRPEAEDVYYSSDESYQGFIDLKGEVVLNDTIYEHTGDFSNGRAFVSKEDGGYILINTSFKQIGRNEYTSPLADTFIKGRAFVKIGDETAVIDTLGNILTQFKDDSFGWPVGEYYFFEQWNDSTGTAFSIRDLNGKLICGPMIQEFDERGYVNDLLRTVINEKLTYIDTHGQIVWQQHDDDSLGLQDLNIDFMNRGHFYVYAEDYRLGHTIKNGESQNQSGTPAVKDLSRFPSHSLSVTIDTSSTVTYARKYSGYKVVISNRTSKAIKFSLQDNRLYMKLQAQNRKGEWKDIEYLPNSWCGNSYHNRVLQANDFWEFTMPKYAGDFRTLVRAELHVVEKLAGGKQEIIHSNVIYAGVNPGQFWNKRIYYPSGIMDPYID